MQDKKIFEDKDQGAVIKALVFKYLRYWYWFLLGLLLALAFVVYHMRYTPKIYTSKARINILDEGKGLDLSNAMYLWKQSSVNLQKEIEIIKSYPILEQVVINQDLMISFYAEGEILTTEINALPFEFIKSVNNDSITPAAFTITVKQNAFEIQKVGTEESIVFPKHSSLGVKHDLPFELNISGVQIPDNLVGNVFQVNFNSIENVVNGLKRSLFVTPVGEDTELLELSYNSQSIEKNERIINELINVFNLDGIEDRRAISLRTYEFIDQRFVTLAKELDSLETDIKDFKQENKIITIESKAGIGMEELSVTEQRLFELENQLNLLGIIESSLKSSDDKIDLLPANIGVSSTNVNESVNNYNKLVLEYQNLKESATKNNPILISLTTKLNNLKQNIFASINSSKVQLRATKEQLERKNQNLVNEIYNIPAKEKLFLDIKRQQEIKQELYLYLLQKREESAINYAITEPSLKVVEYAQSSKTPISPSLSATLPIAVVAGLGIPFAFLYISFLLDTKIKNRESIEKETKKIPVIAELPKNKNEKEMSFLTDNDSSVQAEAFRVLSYNLNYMLGSAQDQKGKVIFSTSSIKGEGKTHVSINLSLVFSSLNHKVLLIGADLRNPQVHNFINVSKDTEGLSKYLFDEEFDWRSGLIQGFDEHPNLHVLLSGSIPPNPSKLLTNGRLKQLLEEARQFYDYIIVDTAPTLLVSDTLLMSPLADATVYLTRSNYTEKKLLDYSKGLSEAGKLKNMAYVINAVDLKKSNSYGYGYGYNYGYNYGYHNQKD
jgi:capsular exopolysaccharide synthesis family protein